MFIYELNTLKACAYVDLWINACANIDHQFFNEKIQKKVSEKI